MRIKIAFLVICTILVVSVGFTAFVSIFSTNDIEYVHEYVDFDIENKQQPEKNNFKSLNTSVLNTTSKNTYSATSSSRITSSIGKTTQSHALASEQQLYLENYFTEYLYRYLATLNEEMAENLLKNFDAYVDKYIEEYFKNAYSSDQASLITSSELISIVTSETSISTSTVTSEVATVPEPPAISDAFLSSEIERISLRFSVLIDINKANNSENPSNNDVLNKLILIETVLSELPLGIVSDFSLSKITITTDSTITLKTNKIVVTMLDDSITLKSKLYGFFTQSILQSGISVNLWQFNPASFIYTGPNQNYTFNINYPERGYFVTYKAQSSEIDDLTEIFVELINNQNRFVRLTEASPLYNKIKLACTELSRQYPSLKSTPTVKAFI